MAMWLNIAGSGRCHNRSGCAGPDRSAHLWSCLPLVIGLGLCPVTGCSEMTPVVEVPAWALAAAKPVTMTPLERTRISSEQRLPDRWVQELSPEFTLVHISNAEDWMTLRQILHLDPNEQIDFERGMVVGILARVGERAEPLWPIRIEAARVVSGVGWIDVLFLPGVYYPLHTAAYADFAFIPDLRKIAAVRIGPRLFMFTEPLPPR